MINVIKFFDVEIWELPKINEKPQQIYFNDLQIRKSSDALGIASPVMKGQ